MKEEIRDYKHMQGYIKYPIAILSYAWSFSFFLLNFTVFLPFSQTFFHYNGTKNNQHASYITEIMS